MKKKRVEPKPIHLLLDDPEEHRDDLGHVTGIEIHRFYFKCQPNSFWYDVDEVPEFFVQEGFVALNHANRVTCKECLLRQTEEMLEGTEPIDQLLR